VRIASEWEKVTWQNMYSICMCTCVLECVRARSTYVAIYVYDQPRTREYTYTNKSARVVLLRHGIYRCSGTWIHMRSQSLWNWKWQGHWRGRGESRPAKHEMGVSVLTCRTVTLRSQIQSTNQNSLPRLQTYWQICGDIYRFVYICLLKRHYSKFELP